jgi:hypothetical protein
MIPLMFAKFLNVVECLSAFAVKAFVHISVDLVLKDNALFHHFLHLVLFPQLIISNHSRYHLPQL